MAYKFNPFTGNLDIEGPILTGSGTVSAAADGTAAIPGISFASDLNTGIYRPGNDQLAISTGGTGRLFIDSSGNVGIGTTSAGTKLDVNDGSANCTIRARTGAGFSSFLNLLPNGSGSGLSLAANADSSAQLFNQLNGYLAFGANNTERMRITSGGDVRIGQSTTSTPANSGSVTGIALDNAGVVSVSATGQAVMVLGRTEDDTIVREYVRFYRSGSSNLAGTITATKTSVAYNTSSDYRLKENVIPLTGAADRVNQLQVRRFNFIADPDKTVDGFLAHEVQDVVPESVTGTKDKVDENGEAEYQAIDQSKLVPLLTAALQEALAKIETLEQRLSDAGIA